MSDSDQSDDSTKLRYNKTRAKRLKTSQYYTDLLLALALSAADKQSISKAIDIPAFRFNFLAASDPTLIFNFRFNRQQIIELTDHLRLPDIIITRNRYKCNSIEALCMVLGRFATPSRIGDLVNLFGCSRERICSIFNYAIDHILDRFKHLLKWDYTRYNLSKLKELAQAVSDAGSALDCCVGFIDGTLRGIVRPGNGVQKAAYNGHKVVLHILLPSICSNSSVPMPEKAWA